MKEKKTTKVGEEIKNRKKKKKLNTSEDGKQRKTTQRRFGA